jgi:hypothetical protein
MPDGKYGQARWCSGDSGGSRGLDFSLCGSFLAMSQIISPAPLTTTDATSLRASTGGRSTVVGPILVQVPAEFRSQMEPLIPANVKAIHEGFSIAAGATFVGRHRDRAPGGRRDRASSSPPAISASLGASAVEIPMWVVL